MVEPIRGVTHANRSKQCEGLMASHLVHDCPRCNASQMTFDVVGDHQLNTVTGTWDRHELFSVCRHCKRSVVFAVEPRNSELETLMARDGAHTLDGFDLTRGTVVLGHVGVQQMGAVPPPEHLPEDIHAVFVEGATCLSAQCWNAAGTMFRLCLDLATQSLLPAIEAEPQPDGLNAVVRRSLGLRLKWLFHNKQLPEALKELSQCVKDDGNDGAHAGTLSEVDANDLLDFACLLMERIYTEPERLKLAALRRTARRAVEGS
jgi:uncharacterized protein DUF4145